LDRKWTNIIIWPRDRASISVQQLRITLILTLFLADIRQDATIRRDFPIPGRGTISKENNENRLKRDFPPLVRILMNKYRTGPGGGGNNSSGKIPENFENIRDKYRITYPEKSIREDFSFIDPDTLEDINSGVIHRYYIIFHFYNSNHSDYRTVSPYYTMLALPTFFKTLFKFIKCS
jgi:hypothetical protein